jgi:hypothetical protein
MSDNIALRMTARTGLIGLSVLSAFSIQPANAQSADEISRQVSRQVVNESIQSVIQSIRDQIQRRLAPAPAVRPLRFSADGNPTEAYYDEVFGALGYAKSSMPTKASVAPLAPPPPPPPALMWGISVTGSVDQQRTTIAGLSTTTNTGSVVGTGDVTKIGVFTASDAVVIGVNGSGSRATTSGTEAKTSGVGTFIAYINGGFSTDFEFNYSSSDSSTTGPLISISTETKAYSYSGNIQYKFDWPNGWWIEPTFGFSVTDTHFDIIGAGSGQTTLVQAGARFGTEVMWNGIRVQPTFTGLAYSNVSVDPGGVAVAIPIPTDEGQLWGKGVAKLNFVFNNQFSAFIEGNIRGTNGTADAIGYGGLVGARIVF